MKKFLIVVALFVGSIVWLNDWISSGKMDNFISQHRHPTYTPKILYAISKFCYLLQQHKTASYYYHWLIEEYPDHPEIAELRWQLAQCYEEIKRRDLALEQYVILKDSFTSTEYGQLADQRYGHLHF